MILLILLLLIFISFSIKMIDKKGDFSLDMSVTKQAKGLAIIMVIISHLSSIDPKWNIFNSFGKIGVAIFLFVSGYGLIKSYAKNGLEDFWHKRITTVMVPYFIVTALWIIVDYFLGKKDLFQNIILSLLGLNFNPSIDGTMWYIPYVMIWYLSFYLVFKFSRMKVISLFGIGLVLFIARIFNIFGEASYHFALHAFTFPIGVFYSLYGERFTEKYKEKFLFLLMTISLLFYLMNISLNGENGLYYMINSILFMIISISIFLILKHKGLILSFLDLVGGYSFELYLFEGYLMNLLIYSNIMSLYYSLWIYLIVLIFMTYILKKHINSKLVISF